MADTLQEWAATPGPAILPTEAIEILANDEPDSPGLQVLVEVIADDQLRRDAGG